MRILEELGATFKEFKIIGAEAICIIDTTEDIPSVIYPVPASDSLA